MNRVMRFYIPASRMPRTTSFAAAIHKSIEEARLPRVPFLVFKSIINEERKLDLSSENPRPLNAKSRWRDLNGAALRRQWVRACLVGLLSCVAMVWLSEQAARMDSFQTNITAGTNPNGLAVNTGTNKIYVANFLSNNVTVINGADNTTATITAGSGPTAIAVNAGTNKIYVANASSSNITVINGADNTTATVTAGGRPNDIAINTVTNKIYVPNGISNDVTVINGADNTTATVTAGTQPTSIAVNPLTNKIYVANSSSNNVTVINGADNTTVTVTAGNELRAIAVNSMSNKIYAANASSNDVTVINGSDNTTQTIMAGTVPLSIAVNPVTNKIYVCNGTSNNVTVINGADTPLLQLILDETGQVGAVDSMLLVRDPFPLINSAILLNLGFDRNTRVTVFVSNLALAQGEPPSSVVINLTGSNNQTYDIPAEDVRPVSNVALTQIIFRLPDNLSAGTCNLAVKAHGLTSNPGAMRISN